MPFRTDLTSRLRIQHPIFQAPLAGGGDTPELVAAVGNAGGLGFIGAAYLSAARIAETARAVRAKTSQPFGINLFAPLPPEPAPKDTTHAIQRVAAYFAELGLQPPSLPEKTSESFEEQLKAALQSGASVFSFTFGIPPANAIEAIKQKNMILLGTATTVEEAVALENAGFDGVVAQGAEAGGHRGSFKADFQSGMIGTMALVPQLVDALKIPVIASGGIMDGRGIAAALALGAEAVQLGTAFLTCDESGISEAYKTAIFEAHEDQTRVTKAFSGRPARGIVNRFMTEVESGAPGDILPFPLQNALTRPLRTAAAKSERAEFLSLWAGQALRLARRQTATQLMSRLVAETQQTLDRLESRCLREVGGAGAAN
jgi:nitronate monooxygenase